MIFLSVIIFRERYWKYSSGRKNKWIFLKTEQTANGRTKAHFQNIQKKKNLPSFSPPLLHFIHSIYYFTFIVSLTIIRIYVSSKNNLHGYVTASYLLKKKNLTKHRHLFQGFPSTRRNSFHQTGMQYLQLHVKACS